MKHVRIIFLLTTALLVSSYPASGKNINTSKYTFYKTYTINIPIDNYVIIGLRGFGPNNYLVLDLNYKNIRIYSPYESKGLLLNRELKKAEIDEIFEIFESEEYMKLPETNNKAALDAEEVDIKSIINKRKKHIHYIMPDDRIIRRIIRLYNGLNSVTK